MSSPLRSASVSTRPCVSTTPTTTSMTALLHSLSLCGQLVECQVEPQDVDAGFAEEPELASLDVLGDQGSHAYCVEAARTGDARHLVVCRRGSDVRVQPAPRCGDEVD